MPTVFVTELGVGMLDYSLNHFVFFFVFASPHQEERKSKFTQICSRVFQRKRLKLLNKFEEEKACNLNYGRRTAVAAGGSHLREQHRAWKRWRVFPLCHWTSENFLLGVYL